MVSPSADDIAQGGAPLEAEDGHAVFEKRDGATSQEASEEAPEDAQEDVAAEGGEDDGVEALEEALAGLEMCELQEMARRLLKCHAGMEGMLEEFEDDRRAWQEENASLHQEISAAMKDVNRLNVTADSALEPAMGSVGRLWDSVRFKPGDAAVVVEAGQQAAQRLQDAFGPIRQSVAGYWKSALSPAEEQKRPRGKTKHRRKSHRPKAEAPAEALEAVDAAATVASGGEGSALTEAEAVGETARTVVRRIPVSANPVIIEAQVALTCGTKHTLQVRVADSMEGAAKRFIHEHMQRAWYEEPLVTWLKKAEAEAERFPVEIEGTLVEIRKNHPKR